MNTLLLFFAFPIATIIISIALQIVLKKPLLVASIIFAVFLVITFVLNDLNFLVATIVYTIISFVTSIIVCLIYKIFNSLNNTGISVSNSQQLLHVNPDSYTINNDEKMTNDYNYFNNNDCTSKINVYSNRVNNKRCSRGKRVF